MKKIWLATLFGLMGLLCIAVVGNWKFRPTPADEELRQTPRPSSELTVTIPSLRTVVNPEELLSRNLFDPGRGQTRTATPKNAPPPVRPAFELVGICRFGDAAGAIIDGKSPAGGETHKMRRYYSLGAEVGGGFILKEIGDDVVLLKHENDVLELKIGRERSKEKVSKNRASLERVENTSPEVRRPGPSPAPPPEGGSSDRRDRATERIQRNDSDKQR